VVEEILNEGEDVIPTEGVDSVVEEILNEGEDVILIVVVEEMIDEILDVDDKAEMRGMIALMSAIEKHVGSAQDTLITEGHNLFALADIKAEIETIEVKARDSRITLS